MKVSPLVRIVAFFALGFFFASPAGWAEIYQWTVLAGDGGSYPTPLVVNGMAAGGDGTAYLLQSGSILRVSKGGVVKKIVVASGNNTTGSGLAVDADNNLFIADPAHHVILKLSNTGVVSTVAGRSGFTGTNDGNGDAARFNQPSGVAVDASGNLYVTDTGNHTIRKISPTGSVITLAGSAGNSGYVNGTGTAARFTSPKSIAVDTDGRLVVVEFNGKAIRAVNSSGLVSTLAGNATVSGTADGTGTAARFDQPNGVAVDGAGNAYITEGNQNTIRKVAPTGAVTTIAGKAGTADFVDGSVYTARFNGPGSVAVDGGGNIVIAEPNNYSLRKINTSGTVTTLASSPPFKISVDGVGDVIRFRDPQALAVDGSGNLFVADADRGIRKLSPAGEASTIAGSSASGPGLAVDLAGNLYSVVSHSIKKVSPAGEVTTLAGNPNQADALDGLGTAARFSGPAGLAVDGGGNILVVDRGNHTIRKIDSTGMVTTLAGSAGVSGSADGPGNLARFNSPTDIAVDAGGTIYVADNGNSAVRKISSSGEVTTLAATNGAGGAVSLPGIGEIAIDGSGNLYVSDDLDILKITPDSVVTTIFKGNLYFITGLAVTAEGKVFFSNGGLTGTRTVSIGSPAATLIYPGNEAALRGLVAVQFLLPEAAQANSVNLTFTGESTGTLTLASSQETAGGHRFTFDSSNPTDSPQIAGIAGGETIPDGVYSVTLSYLNALSNPVTSVSTGVKIDTTPPQASVPAQIQLTAGAGGTVVLGDLTGYVTCPDNFTAHPTVEQTPEPTTVVGVGNHTVNFTVADEAGNFVVVHTAVTVVPLNVPDTTPPVASVPGQIQLTADAGGTVALGDLTGRVTCSDNVTLHPTVVQTPGPATVVDSGNHTVSFLVSDEASNSVAVSTTVVVVTPPIDPSVTSSPQAGPVVRGTPLGSVIPSGSGLPDTSTLAAFFVPAVSDDGQIVARATVLDGRTRLDAVYRQNAAREAGLVAWQTGPAPNANGVAIPNVTFKSFLDPIVSPDGAIAFGAKLQGTGAKAGVEGVWSDVFSSGQLKLLLRAGSAVPGLANGEKLKAVTSLSLGNDGLLALLQLAPAKNVVTTKDDTALVLITGPVGGQVLLREGKPLNGVAGSTIKSFSVLQPALGSPGQGRWHGAGVTLAKVVLVNGPTLIVKIADDGTVTSLLSTVDAAVAVDANAHWKSFGVPAIGGGTEFVVSATLQPLAGVVTTKDDVVLLHSQDGSSWDAFARKGLGSPISTGGVDPCFATFFDPVVNEAGQVAFLSTLAGGDVKGVNKTALFSGPVGSLQLTARLGDPVPDEDGQATTSKWSKFISHALPSGLDAGVVLLAETSGGDTKPANKLAVWAVDSQGSLRRLLRTGSPVTSGGPLLTGLTLLNSLPGSFGTARSYNSAGSVAVLATFADKTQALLRVDIP